MQSRSHRGQFTTSIQGVKPLICDTLPGKPLDDNPMIILGLKPAALAPCHNGTAAESPVCG